jgi:hypothetical protein
MKKSTIITLVITILFIAGVVWLIRTPGKADKPGKLDTFATCLKESGAIFYGAFWCPHCQAQKALFGSSVKLLPYVECSTPDGQGQTQVCKDQKIDGYPTWVFPDGTREGGEQTLEHLSEVTKCELPQ